MNGARILVIGDEVASFQSLKKLIGKNNINIICYCATSPELSRSSLSFAKKKGINLIDFSKLGSSDLKIDYILNIFSTRLLDHSVLELPKHGCFNLHPGILPEYAGLHVHQWAIRNGEKITGVTCHLMEKNIDSGDILFKSIIPISKQETGLSLYSKLSNLASESAGKFCDIISNKRLDSLQLEKQDRSRFNLYTKEMALKSTIDFNWNFKTFDAFMRASNYLPFKSPTYTPSIFDSNRIFTIESYELLSKEQQVNYSKPKKINRWILEKGLIYIFLSDSIVKVTSYREESR